MTTLPKSTRERFFSSRLKESEETTVPATTEETVTVPDLPTAPAPAPVDTPVDTPAPAPEMEGEVYPIEDYEIPEGYEATEVEEVGTDVLINESTILEKGDKIVVLRLKEKGKKKTSGN